ncbi:MAG: sugar transferase [Gemmatimonadetes bacterium]|nr:sugar transferase [Gemmatimonadota bacterium]
MIKRALDLLLSLAGLVVLAPSLAAIAILIKLDSRGPVLFRQERVGRRFRRFRIYKFRTMVAGADRLGAALTGERDPRVTRVGRRLRHFKLDELPQLFNVVAGDMSLVGPRPEVPRYVEHFRGDYEEILTVRPGMTDLASLKYRNESATLAGGPDVEARYLATILPDKIRLGKEYLRRSGLGFDLQLVLFTMLALVGFDPPEKWGTS